MKAVSPGKPSYNQGHTLVEVLLAAAIFMVFVSAVVILFGSGQNNAIDAELANRAMLKTRDSFEAVRLIRDRDWTLLTDGSHGLRFINNQWEFFGTSDISNGITRTVVVASDPVDGSKVITASTSWTAQTPQEFAMTEKIGPLVQGLHGSWTMPCIKGSVDAGSGSKGSDVYYANNRVYVSSAATSAGKEDLFVFNVLNPATPTLVGQKNFEEGWKSVTVDTTGTYAYGIEESSNDFFVANVSNPANITQVAKRTLTGGGSGTYVMVRGNYVYATTKVSASGPEFFVIDVTTPSNPTIIATLEYGADLNEVNILQNRAYVATSSDTKELVVIDVATPSAPVEIGSYNASGTADGTSVHAKSLRRIYLGRAQSTDKEIIILDAGTPSAITLRGTTDVGSKIHTILTAGTLSFVGTDDTNSEFQAFYVRDPEDIPQYSSMNLSNIGSGLAYFNNYVYMSVRNNDILQIISAMENGVCGG